MSTMSTINWKGEPRSKKCVIAWILKKNGGKKRLRYLIGFLPEYELREFKKTQIVTF